MTPHPTYMLRTHALYSLAEALADYSPTFAAKFAQLRKGRTYADMTEELVGDWLESVQDMPISRTGQTVGELRALFMAGVKDKTS